MSEQQAAEQQHTPEWAINLAHKLVRPQQMVNLSLAASSSVESDRKHGKAEIARFIADHSPLRGLQEPEVAIRKAREALGEAEAALNLAALDTCRCAGNFKCSTCKGLESAREALALLQQQEKEGE